MTGYVHGYCSISRINSFEEGIITSQRINKETVHPDYKLILPIGITRRMGNLLKMGIGCAIKVKGDYSLDGIIVGTGLGCIENTEIFLREFIHRTEGILSPTAFIQSTHNTIAGQIGLILKNNCYNATYTQRGQSFENALIDALLLASESQGNILVGAADEKTEILNFLGQKAKIYTDDLSEGASFFIVNNQNKNALAKIVACTTLKSITEDIHQDFQDFISGRNLPFPDLILYGNSFPNNAESIPKEWNKLALIDYSKLSGIHLSNSAFGVQMACELLHKSNDNKHRNIAVINNFRNTRFGITYLQKSET